MTDSSNTAESILRCAQSLIIAGGYNGFSYADIAQVIGIRNASIHHHFPTKAVLVRTLVARYREEMQASVAKLEQHVSNPLEQLRAYAKFWEVCIADASSSFCVCALLASEMPILPEEIALEVRAHFRALATWLTTVFARGAQQGSLALTESAEAEADIFLATVHGAMLSARAYGDAKMFGAIVNPVLLRVARQA